MGKSGADFRKKHFPKNQKGQGQVSVMHDGTSREFVRLTRKRCVSCHKSAQMGVVRENDGTTTLECENPYCQATEHVLTRQFELQEKNMPENPDYDPDDDEDSDDED